MSDPCVLHVRGTPRPKQSARYVNGRFVSVAAARKLLKLWTTALKAAGNQWRRQGNEQIDGAVCVDISFFFGTKKAERHGQPHTFVPDKDNLEKAVLDALKGIVFTDDSRVSDGSQRKRWSHEPGAVITVTQMGQHEWAEDDEDDLGAEILDEIGQHE